MDTAINLFLSWLLCTLTLTGQSAALPYFSGYTNHPHYHHYHHQNGNLEKEVGNYGKSEVQFPKQFGNSHHHHHGFQHTHSTTWNNNNQYDQASDFEKLFAQQPHDQRLALAYHGMPHVYIQQKYVAPKNSLWGEMEIIGQTGQAITLPKYNQNNHQHHEHFHTDFLSSSNFPFTGTHINQNDFRYHNFMNINRDRSLTSNQHIVENNDSQKKEEINLNESKNLRDQIQPQEIGDTQSQFPKISPTGQIRRSPIQIGEQNLGQHLKIKGLYEPENLEKMGQQPMDDNEGHLSDYHWDLDSSHKHETGQNIMHEHLAQQQELSKIHKSQHLYEMGQQPMDDNNEGQQLMDDNAGQQSLDVIEVQHPNYHRASDDFQELERGLQLHLEDFHEAQHLGQQPKDENEGQQSIGVIDGQQPEYQRATDHFQELERGQQLEFGSHLYDLGQQPMDENEGQQSIGVIDGQQPEYQRATSHFQELERGQQLEFDTHLHDLGQQEMDENEGQQSIGVIEVQHPNYHRASDNFQELERGLQLHLEDFHDAQHLGQQPIDENEGQQSIGVNDGQQPEYQRATSHFQELERGQQLEFDTHLHNLGQQAMDENEGQQSIDVIDGQQPEYQRGTNHFQEFERGQQLEFDTHIHDLGQQATDENEGQQSIGVIEVQHPNYHRASDNFQELEKGQQLHLEDVHDAQHLGQQPIDENEGQQSIGVNDGQQPEYQRATDHFQELERGQQLQFDTQLHNLGQQPMDENEGQQSIGVIEVQHPNYHRASDNFQELERGLQLHLEDFHDAQHLGQQPIDENEGHQSIGVNDGQQPEYQRATDHFQELERGQQLEFDSHLHDLGQQLMDDNEGQQTLDVIEVQQPKYQRAIDDFQKFENGQLRQLHNFYEPQHLQQMGQQQMDDDNEGQQPNYRNSDSSQKLEIGQHLMDEHLGQQRELGHLHESHLNEMRQPLMEDDIEGQQPELDSDSFPNLERVENVKHHLDNTGDQQPLHQHINEFQKLLELSQQLESELLHTGESQGLAMHRESGTFPNKTESRSFARNVEREMPELEIKRQHFVQQNSPGNEMSSDSVSINSKINEDNHFEPEDMDAELKEKVLQQILLDIAIINSNNHSKLQKIVNSDFASTLSPFTSVTEENQPTEVMRVPDKKKHLWKTHDKEDIDYDTRQTSEEIYLNIERDQDYVADQGITEELSRKQSYKELQSNNKNEKHASIDGLLGELEKELGNGDSHDYNLKQENGKNVTDNGGSLWGSFGSQVRDAFNKARNGTRNLLDKAKEKIGY